MSVTIFNQLDPTATFTFDNIDSFTVVPDIQITQHPIETGTDVSDHAQTRNQVLLVVGRVTATPFTVPAPEAFEAAQMFFENNERQLVTVVSPLGVFTDCLYQSYPRTFRVVQELVFNVRFVQIRLASAVSVPIPPRTPAPPLQAGAPSPQDAGVQPAAAASAPVSLLAAVSGAGL